MILQAIGSVLLTAGVLIMSYRLSSIIARLEVRIATLETTLRANGIYL